MRREKKETTPTKNILFGRKNERKDIIDAISEARDGAGSMILLKGEAGIGKTTLLKDCVNEAGITGFDIFWGPCFDYRRAPHQPFIDMVRENLSITKGDVPGNIREKVKKKLRGPVLNDPVFFEEFTDLFISRSEPVGGFRAEEDEIGEILEQLGSKGFRTVILKDRKVPSIDNGGVEVINIGDDGRSSIQPTRLERIATMIRAAFTRYQHCAILNLSTDLLIENNPSEKFGSFIRIVNGLAVEKGGIAIHVQGKEENEMISRFEDISPVLCSDDEEPQGQDVCRERKMTANDIFQKFFTEHSGTRPVLLVLEDLQWADSQTLNLLQMLARDIQDKRICIMGSYRPEESGIEDPDPDQATLKDALQRISRERLFRTISLKRFDMDEVEGFIKDHLQVHDIDTGSIISIMNETEGIPGLVVDHIRKIREEDASSIEPADVHELVKDKSLKRRLTSLNERSRQMLDHASAMGKSAELGILSASMKVGDEDTLDILDDLLDSRLVKESESGLEFEHVKTREQIYAAIPEGRRMGIHLKIAHVIDGLSEEEKVQKKEELAYHYSRGGMFKEAAVEYIDSARLELDNSNEEKADEMLKRGLENLAKLPPGKQSDQFRIRILLMRGDIQDSLGNTNGALLSFREAGELSEKISSVRDRSRSYRRTGDIMLKLFELDRTIDNYLRSLHLSKQEEDQHEIAMAFRGLGTIYYLKGDYERSMDCYLKFMDFQKKENVSLNIVSLIEIADIYFEMGDLNQSLAYFKLAIKRGEESGNKKDCSLAYVKMANILLRIGDVEEAMRYGSWGYNMIKDHLNSEVAQKALLLYMELMIEIGDMPAVEEAKELLDTLDIKGQGDRLLRCSRERVLGLFEAKKRNFEKAGELLDKALDILSSMQVPFHLALTKYQYGLVLFQEMKVDEALVKLNEAADIFRSINSKHYLNRASSKIRELSFIKETMR